MANNNLQATIGLDTSEYEKALKDAQKATEGFEEATRQANEEVKKQAEENKKTSKALNDGRSALKNYNASIKELKGQLLQLEEGSKEYKATMQKLADEMKRFSDINEVARMSANDLGERLNVLTQFGGQIASGFAVAQGTMGLFGAESENLQKALLKVQSALAIVQGLQGLEGITKTLPVVKNMVVSLTSAISKQFLALMKNPWVALATVLAGVVTYLISGTEWFKKLTGQINEATTASNKFGLSQEQITKAQEEANSTASDLLAKYLNLRNEWQNLTTAQEKNKWISDNKKQFDELGISINSVVEAENALISNTDAFIQALVNRSLADAYKNQMDDVASTYLKALSDAKNISTTTTWDELKNSYPEIWDMLQKDTRGNLEGLFKNSGTGIGGYIYKLTEDGVKRIPQAIENYLKTTSKVLGNAIQDLETKSQDLLKSNGITTTTTTTPTAPVTATTSKPQNTKPLIENPSNQDVKSNIEYFWQSVSKAVENSSPQLAPIRLPNVEALLSDYFTTGEQDYKNKAYSQMARSIGVAYGSQNDYSNRLSILEELRGKTNDQELIAKIDTEIKEIKNQIEALEQQQLQTSDPEGYKIAETNKALQEQINLFNGIADVSKALSGCFDDNTAKWLGFVSQFMSSVGGVLKAYQALTGAAAMKSVAETPIVGWLGMGAALASTFALFAQLPKFEKGGIVGGFSYHNDRVLARLSSGELVLPRSEQAKLWRAIQSGNFGTSEPQYIEVRVKGKDLVGVLRNYGNKTSKLL
ncbi:MAG: hypothetical protein ACI30M_02605 [Muribaculaceae bacterium]